MTRILLAATVLLLAAQPPAAVVIEHGPRTARRVALTFDADMTGRMLAELRRGKVESWYDARIVRYLRATRTPATIFLTGLWTRTYPRAVRSLARDPLFELENHSWDHAAWTRGCYGLPALTSVRRKRAEVVAAAREIARVTGRRPSYFRFPGGCHTQVDVRLVAATRERVVGWDVVSGDAFQPNPAPIVAQVLGGVRPGSIVVMHLVGAPNAPATYAALKRIVPALRRRGYRFVTVDRLLRE